MNLNLPPKNATPTTENIATLKEGLSSVIAFHPRSVNPWDFYEVVDAYLGPWGKSGYPIGYGKYYCIAFNTNPHLQANLTTRDWVRKTTLALQVPLRDLIVQKFIDKTLNSITEPEFRAFAFNAHPRAYTNGGLTLVTMAAPEMLPIIASIPYKEFSPDTENFSATIKQVLVTMGIVIPQAGAVFASTLAGPAHTGIFRRAIQMDYAAMREEQGVFNWLNETQRILESGQLDNISSLNKLTAKLSSIAFNDLFLSQKAKMLIDIAVRRKHIVAEYYRKQIAMNPQLVDSINKIEPGWNQW